MQTSGELVMNLFGNKKTDRVGYFDHGPWTTALRRWINEGYPILKDISLNDKPIPDDVNMFEDKAIPDYRDYFGYDMFSAGGWFDIMPHPGYYEVLEERGDWVIFRNGAGAVMRKHRDNISTPEYIEFKMTNRKIWENEYRSLLTDNFRERVNPVSVKDKLEYRKKKGCWTFYGHQFIWENMRSSMGNQCMLESMLLDQDWIHDFNRVYTDLYKNIFSILLEEAGIPDGIWIYEDLAYKNDLVCSPMVLEKMIFPYYKEIIDFFHSYDLPVILHSDGKIDKAIPLMIEAGFCAINPIEVKAGCDIRKYHNLYGDKLAFIGGFDGRVLETNDKCLIKNEVKKLLSYMKECGGKFLFGVDHSIPDTVSLETFQYMFDVYKENMYI